ncbi:MAG TPA: carbamoyltransferase C-terminal domain-containing protein [Steroidobacteraceae bacterium]|jgi:carbamoyltransferase
MNILSINFNHDGAAVVLRDGDIAGYVNTERFSRRKKHPGVRGVDVENVIAQAGLTLADIDLVQLVNLNNMDSADVVRLHGSTLKETWSQFWVDGTYGKVSLLEHTLPCWVVPAHLHHAAHTAVAYHFAPFDCGVTFACDPFGADAYFVRGNEAAAQSPGVRMVAPLVYNYVAERLFGNALVGAGKLMGLAPYGADAARLAIDYQGLLALDATRAFEALVNATRDSPVEVHESGVTLNASLAWQAQAFLEYEMSRTLDLLYASCTAFGLEPNLCLSGGTALNSVANQRCFAASKFRNLYLHPACGDDGTAIGAALMQWHAVLKNPRKARTNRQAMYSCRTYEHEVEGTLDRYRDRVLVRRPSDPIGEAAQLLAGGKVVGWFQGPSEIGPRALGNRSILADPRSPTMKDHLNRQVKRREAFRPFAPSVLAEHAQRWFGESDSPFMLRVAPVQGNAVPAVTHVDGTARFQTVRRADNPRYYDLIERFQRLTDIPMVLNTSFNGRAEPIVETPQDALECMLTTGLDAVVFPEAIVVSRA